MTDAPIRWTRGKVSYELSWLRWFFIKLGHLSMWGFARMKPLAYHPLAIIGLAFLITTYAISPWITATLFWVLLLYQRLYPYSYLRHVHSRTRSFFAGFRYRHRPRRRLKANGLINDEDPIPTVSYVTKIGCTTKVRIKMSDGDEIEYWRERSKRIAQTYNALDCKIDPYRRHDFKTFRIDKVTLKPPFVVHRFDKEKIIKPRWLELEFLTSDPFTKIIGPEYIDFYRTSNPLPEEGNPVGPYRSGRPRRFLVRTHKLVVAPSQRGKSSAERVMIFADHEAVQARLVENWMCDLKRGVEGQSMEGQCARVEYGLDGPEMVARFFEDAQRVMNRRLDKIREAGEDVRHVATPGDPALRIYIDEFLAFEDTEYNEHRSRIYRAISAIQRRGAAAGVSIIAFSQDPKKDKFPLRDGFLEVEVGGGLTRTQCEMVMPGAWDMGVRTADVDLPGVFYVRSENILMPEQFRYVYITPATIKGLKRRPDSAFELTPEEKKDISGVFIA